MTYNLTTLAKLPNEKFVEFADLSYKLVYDWEFMYISGLIDVYEHQRRITLLNSILWDMLLIQKIRNKNRIAMLN